MSVRLQLDTLALGPTEITVISGKGIQMWKVNKSDDCTFELSADIYVDGETGEEQSDPLMVLVVGTQIHADAVCLMLNWANAEIHRI